MLNDPRLLQIFDGEEYTRGMRMWTHGYDLYTPHRNLVFHGRFPATPALPFCVMLC